MKRGEIYRVQRPGKNDPKVSRLFVIVSRPILIESQHSTVICAPIYSSIDGLATQVTLGILDGMKKSCSIHCDELISLRREMLTNFVSTLSALKIFEMNKALLVALDIE